MRESPATLTTMNKPDACLNIPALASHLEAVRVLCQEHGIARLDVFGSVCTADFDPATSDIDFIVEYPPGHDLGPWMRNLLALQDQLQQILGCKVDVVLADALQNRWFRQEAEKTRATVYDATAISDGVIPSGARNLVSAGKGRAPSLRSR